MARYKNGINGPVSGKIGNVIGSSTRGVNYLKSVSRVSKRKPTEAQLLQRDIFALVSGWLNRIREVISVGYRLFSGSVTPINAAIGIMMREAVRVADGRPEIDFSKVVLSRGELLISWIMEVIILAEAALEVVGAAQLGLRIKWDDAVASAFCRSDDRATFVFYSEAARDFMVFKDGVARSEREAVLALPAAFREGPVHCYMFYTNAAGDAVSTSQYLSVLS